MKKCKPPNKRTFRYSVPIESGEVQQTCRYTNVCVQTDKYVTDDELALVEKVDALEIMVKCRDQQLLDQNFHLMNIKDDEKSIVLHWISILWNNESVL